MSAPADAGAPSRSLPYRHAPPARQGSLPLPRRHVRRSAHCGAADAASAADRAVDPGRRFRPARRRGARGRCRRRRLDPCRRDGRALRAQHLHRARRGEGAAPAHQEDIRRPSDDRAVRSLSRSLRQGRLRHHHGACGGRPAHPPLAAGDPRARQEGRRHAQSRHAGKHDRAGDRPGRSHPGDVGQSGLRRAGLHPLRGREDCAAARARGRASDRHRGRRRHHAGERRQPSRARAPTCWSRAPPCSRAASPTTIAPTSRRSAMPRRWHVGRLRNGCTDRRQVDATANCRRRPARAANSSAPTAGSATASPPTARRASRPSRAATTSTSRTAARGRTAR